MKELLLQQRPGAPHGETRELSSSNGAETTPSGGSGLLLVVLPVCLYACLCVGGWLVLFLAAKSFIYSCLETNSSYSGRILFPEATLEEKY